MQTTGGTEPSGQPTHPGDPRPHARTTSQQSHRHQAAPADPPDQTCPSTRARRPESEASAKYRHRYWSNRPRCPRQRRNRHRSTTQSHKSPGSARNPAAAGSPRYHPQRPRAAPGRWQQSVTSPPKYRYPKAPHPDQSAPQKQPPRHAPQPKRTNPPTANTGSSAKSAPQYQHPPCAKANAPHGSHPTSDQPPQYPTAPGQHSAPEEAEDAGSPNRTSPN